MDDLEGDNADQTNQITKIQVIKRQGLSRLRVAGRVFFRIFHIFRMRR